MKTITLVTSNADKLRELQTIFPADLKLQAQSLDLDEIQSLDPREIIAHKLRQAYAVVQGPVIVDDVSAELEKLNGLPGPFIKFFEKQLGKEALYVLGGESRAQIVGTIGYFDGEHEVITQGILPGKIVAPRGGQGWGFDFVFVPDGYDKTFSELGPEMKNHMSHRALACRNLVQELQKLGL